VHRAITNLYRLCAYPIAKGRLRAMADQGLPAALVDPLRYLIDRRLSADDRAVADKIESLRATLARGAGDFEVIYQQVPGGPATRSADWIAHRSSITMEWGIFLHLCVKSFAAGTVLELGSCAGISGCYLAAAPSVDLLITVEGAPALARLAEHNIRQVSNRAVVLNTLFDDALDSLPDRIKTLDFVFIDGHHTREARHHYLDRLTSYLRPGSVVVFDDIHLTEDLWRAWHELRRRPGVSHAVNAGRFGLCIWGSDASVPRYYDFSTMTGCLRIGGRRWKWREESRMRV
jgi:predicted O-methyltransferase YrrM